MRTAPPTVIVGFNRAGTTALYRMFELSGLNSAHWQLPVRNRAQLLSIQSDRDAPAASRSDEIGG